MRPEIIYDEHGVPRSSQFDDVYHSVHGAVAQSQHVFIQGNQLQQRWQEDQITGWILETGFGLGVNFFTTVCVWLNTASPNKTPLKFISIERYLPSAADIKRVWVPLINSLESEDQLVMQKVLDQLLSAWPSEPGEYTFNLYESRVKLHLILGDVIVGLEEIEQTHQACASDWKIDAIYLDGFNPAKNPQMWTPLVFQKIAKLCHVQTTLATWAVSRVVKDGLLQNGFVLSKRPGFLGKREMLTAAFKV